MTTSNRTRTVERLAAEYAEAQADAASAETALVAAQDWMRTATARAESTREAMLDARRRLVEFAGDAFAPATEDADEDQEAGK